VWTGSKVCQAGIEIGAAIDLGRHQREWLLPSPPHQLDFAQGHPAAATDHRRGHRAHGAVVLLTSRRPAGHRTGDLGQQRLHDAVIGAHCPAIDSVAAALRRCARWARVRVPQVASADHLSDVGWGHCRACKSACAAQCHPVGVLLGQEVADRELHGCGGRIGVEPVDS
jgi:hypothetical protein